MDQDSLVKMLLAELVDEMGGVVKLDANKLLADLKEEKFKDVAIRFEDGSIIVEVLDLNEN